MTIAKIREQILEAGHVPSRAGSGGSTYDQRKLGLRECGCAGGTQPPPFSHSSPLWLPERVNLGLSCYINLCLSAAK